MGSPVSESIHTTYFPFPRRSVISPFLHPFEGQAKSRNCRIVFPAEEFKLYISDALIYLKIEL